MGTVIEDFIADAWRKRQDAIEAMCERMLVTPGRYGVLVEDWSDASWRVTLSQHESPMEITYRRREGSKPA